MSNYLGQHYDAALDIEGIGSREELEARQVDRISRELAIIIVTGTIPRRLGTDATAEELALDKKRARRVGHALKQSLSGWTKKYKLEADEEIRRAGAQLDWTTWLPAATTAVMVNRRLIATYAIRSQQESWGKSAIVKLNNELNWIEHAMRE